MSAIAVRMPASPAPTRFTCGIWRGSAMQDGKAVQVAIDFKGNVVTQASQ